MNYMLVVALGFVVLTTTMFVSHERKDHAWRQPASLWAERR